MPNKKKKHTPKSEPNQRPIDNDDMDKKGCKKLEPEPDTGTITTQDEEGSGGGNPPPDKPRDN